MSERSRRSAGADQGSAHPLPSSPCRPSAHSPQPSPSSRLPTQMRTSSSRFPAPPLLPVSQPARSHTLAGSASGGQVHGSVRVTLERLYRTGGCPAWAGFSLLTMPVCPPSQPVCQSARPSPQCSAALMAQWVRRKGSRLYRAGPPLPLAQLRKAAGVFKKEWMLSLSSSFYCTFARKFRHF